MPFQKPPITDSTSPCSAILQDGLYDYLNIQKSANFEGDIRTYFQSQTFKNDLKNNKWGGTLNVIIEEVPVGLSANASDNEINTFQQRIAASNSVQISQSSFDQIVSKIPNIDLAREYTKCIIATRGFGFVIEDESITENSVVLKVAYLKRISEDPMPTVKKASVRGGRDVEGLPAEGSQIEDEFVISFSRTPFTDAYVIINTDREAFTYPIPKDFGAADTGVPVGTIIASSLTFAQFRSATKDDKIAGTQWLSYKSKWAPCDGRPVPESAYGRFSQRNVVPDLRGVFLRGLNQFDPNTLIAQKPGQLDPDQRLVESFQDDAFESHTHTAALRQTAVPFGAGPYMNPVEPQRPIPGNAEKTPVTIDAVGGPESRPKNIAIYYYIRIN
ncbi:MAG TPA: hypothetical protein VGO11_06890 [Chthoniobacteraceae bacterium]|jgi:hypothetical protein|nr:hypothetical protein [Chthoniobacteraceae bacterium]